MSGARARNLAAACRGESNKQISGLLELTVVTVQTHRTAIMSKLNATSIAELARYAVRNTRS